MAKIDDSVKKKVPELRFKGFTDDWEQRKFGVTNSYFTDGNYGESYPSADELSDKLNGVPFLRGSNLKNGRLVEEDANYITPEKHAELTSGHLELDDIVVAVRGSLGALGYAGQENVGWNINSQLAIIRTDKSELKGQFLIQYLLSSKGQKELLSRNTGTALKQLPIKQLKDVPVPIPGIDEQDRIGSFFVNLDTTIALHQRKLDLLKETKKGFLQKMFPKNGAKVPEIRFTGFTGDWEERKLGEVVVFLNGRAFKQQELLDSGKYRVLRVGNFNTNDRWYYSNLELEEDKYANKGDLLYLWATSFGPEMWNEERVIYHYHIWKLKFLSKELDKQYLYTWLLTDKEKIKESTNGTTMVHVTKGGIEQRTFQFPPDINEQQKIGAFFKQLDDTIALHQRKLDLLKETKKGFLQKMFV
ncbi:restriction endonuclease subunit S [Enterococcus faecalis]|nr:restriction endonuclease subunit S [Enterococcus faecalis]MEB7498568.1 restriction endonuclease subunit S [Enterococcus faecalis]